MTPHQLAALFCALPFLSLAAAWLVALSFLIPKQQPVKVRAKKRGGQ